VFDRFISERRRSRGKAEAPWRGDGETGTEGGDELFPELASADQVQAGPPPMATNSEKPDFKKQFRAMAPGSQSLTVAYIGVVNDLIAALKRLGTGDVAAMATAAHMDT
jgi:hypothetical protein